MAGPGNARHRRNPGATDAGRADAARSGGESNPAMPQAVELLFFETPPRPYAEVAAELALRWVPSGLRVRSASSDCAESGRTGFH